MALGAKSLFLYGYAVTTDNCNLDYRAVALETPRQAVLRLGQYSLDGLCREIKRALQSLDAVNVYTVAADRTFAGGLENRITIATSGAFLSLLFASGPNTATTCAPLLGFPVTDQTGHVTYTGIMTTGTAFQPNADQVGIFGYNFLPPDDQPKVTGSLNIAASGVKEAVVMNIQKFWNVEFKYISSADAAASWAPLITWMIQARSFEFTPEIPLPTVYYEGTLETPSLTFMLREMLPSFPNTYQTGPMKFRQRLSS